MTLILRLAYILQSSLWYIFLQYFLLWLDYELDNLGFESLNSGKGQTLILFQNIQTNYTKAPIQWMDNRGKGKVVEVLKYEADHLLYLYLMPRLRMSAAIPPPLYNLWFK
jgi:hypothetical protein